MDKRDRYELAKANSLASWSFIGILFPVIGWILAGLSLSKARVLLEEYEDNERISERIHNVRTKAHNAILLSVLAIIIGSMIGFFMFKWYSDQQADAEQAAQQAQQQQIQTQQQASFYRQQQLNICIDNTNNWYNKNLSNIQTIYQEQALNDAKEQYIEECRLKNPVY